MDVLRRRVRRDDEPLSFRRRPTPDASSKPSGRPRNPHLATAAAQPERWLLTLTAQLLSAGTTSIGPAVEALRAQSSSTRHRWQITHPAPLGDAASDTSQAKERTLPTLAIDTTAELANPTPPDGIETDRAEQLRLDDTLSW